MNEGVSDCGNASVTRYRNGCRCLACREFAYIAQKRRNIKLAEEGPQIVDATDARRRLIELSEAGMPQREICNYGMSLPTVQKIMSGKRKTIRRSTHDKIMAIEGRRPNRNQRVSPKGSMELVRKWHDGGLEFSLIGRLTGVSPHSLRELYNGKRSWIYARTAVALRMHGAEVLDALICKRREEASNGKDNQKAR